MNEMSGISIDRTSPEPYYLQLSRLVEAEIDAGHYGVGDRLPGETELCRRFDLARSTVRETLRSLQERGRIKMVPRRGAFVIDSQQSGWLLQVAQGFFEAEVDHHRRTVTTEIVGVDRISPPQPVADALGIEKGGVALRLQRLRRLDGQIALFSINYLLPDLEEVVRRSSVMTGEGSLNRTLREAGHPIFGAKRSVEAVEASSSVSRLLKVEAGVPLLLVTSASWGKDQKIFDYYTSWVRSDVVKVTIEARMAIDEA